MLPSIDSLLGLKRLQQSTQKTTDYEDREWMRLSKAGCVTVPASPPRIAEPKNGGKAVHRFPACGFKTGSVLELGLSRFPSR